MTDRVLLDVLATLAQMYRCARCRRHRALRDAWFAPDQPPVDVQFCTQRYCCVYCLPPGIDCWRHKDGVVTGPFHK